MVQAEQVEPGFGKRVKIKFSLLYIANDTFIFDLRDQIAEELCL